MNLSADSFKIFRVHSLEENSIKYIGEKKGIIVIEAEREGYIRINKS